ncbi:MAG: class I SAM-dependent methyltransferase [Patescibacteria group bacterium]
MMIYKSDIDFTNVLAHEALEFLLHKHEFTTILDIGCGKGIHANIFRQYQKEVITIDFHANRNFQPDIYGDYLQHEFKQKFDVIWCSHVLEHQLNVNLFLRKIWHDLESEGIFAITVPPMKPQIVGGHVTIWNAGLLIYNLILAGFDCSQCQLKKYGYNISIIGKKEVAKLPELRMDEGDIERLAQYFPLPVLQGFNGDIKEINWNY